jgi:hypothetical protein
MVIVEPSTCLQHRARPAFLRRGEELLAGRSDLGDADISRAAMAAQKEVWIRAVGMRPEF